ncbi:hypothetical protein D3C72_1973610 [compost metagenome]
MQRLVVGLAIEGGGDAFLGKGTEFLCRFQFGVEEDVASVDRTSEISVLVQLIDE